MSTRQTRYLVEPVLSTSWVKGVMREAGASTERSSGRSMAITVVPWLFLAPFLSSRVVMYDNAKGGHVLNPR